MVDEDGMAIVTIVGDPVMVTGGWKRLGDLVGGAWFVAPGDELHAVLEVIDRPAWADRDGLPVDMLFARDISEQGVPAIPEGGFGAEEMQRQVFVVAVDTGTIDLLTY